MKILTKLLNDRLTVLRKAIKLAEKQEGTFPEGRLRVSKSKGNIRYYKMLDNGNKTGEYLSVSNVMEIRQLAQKDYNREFLKIARKEERRIGRMLSQTVEKSAESAYDDLSAERKKLVSPYILSDDLIAKKWQSKTFKTNPYKPELRIYDTRRGEKVRSKSEAIIADMLYEMGIPYHYEYPVKMCNGKVKYPDFTLLKVKSREVIYLEHFGKLQEEGYRKDTAEKLDLYRASGIFPGKNLMFTYEIEGVPLDINGIKKMLTEIFL